MQPDNTQALLAKLMATENIRVEHDPSAKTASFDLKSRVLRMPVWTGVSKDLEHLLIGHETGHALDTPPGEEYRNAYTKIANNVFGSGVSRTLIHTVAGFLNIIEDIRIDKRSKRRFPGLRRNYLIGYKELIDRNFFGTVGRDIDSMVFIDRANIYFKGGSVYFNISFSKDELVFIKRMEDLETWEQVVELTEDVYRFCVDQLTSQNQQSAGGVDIIIGDDDEEGEGEYDDYFDDGYDSDSEDDDSGEDEGDSGKDSLKESKKESNGTKSGDNGKEDSEEDSEKETKGKKSNSGGKSSQEKKEEENNSSSKSEGGNKPTKEKESNGKSNKSPSSGAGAGSSNSNIIAPESETFKVWERKQLQLVSDSNVEYVYTEFPDPIWQKLLHPYKRVLHEWRQQISNRNFSQFQFNENRRHFMQWRLKEKDSISFLVKEFEQRKSAEIYSRISTAKTGMIDTNKLHSYRYNEDLFKRLSVIPEGKNHGFVMFLDWSGSMDSALKETMKQLFTLVLFCKQIQVPFEVYAFKDGYGSSDCWSYTGKKNAIRLGANVCLRQFLSSSMSNTDFNDAMTFMWSMAHGTQLYCDRRNGTPLNDALIIAPTIVNDFRKKFKLEIVNTIILTDGESNGFQGIEPKSVQYNSVKTKKYFYLDKETGKTIEIYPNSYADARSNTINLLSLLKEKTQCNLVGFFLYRGSWRGVVRMYGLEGTSEFERKASSFWRENKFYPVKSAGYDEYFVIDTEALKEPEVALKIDVCKNTKQMAKAFSAFAMRKTVNRVLLRNFINHVTGQVTKTKKVA